MKGIFLGILCVLIWQSPDLRNKTSSAFRTAADWIQLKDGEKSPKNFVIPNPFYEDKK